MSRFELPDLEPGDGASALPMLVKGMVETHIARGGLHCPECGYDLDTGDMDYQGVFICVEINCRQCEYRGRNVYRLVDLLED